MNCIKLSPMNVNLTRTGRMTPSKGASSPTVPSLTLITYAVSPEVARDCEAAASELRIGRAEVKHLQAACAALEAHPQAFVVASAAIKSWDRHVLEEHAYRAGATLQWIDGERDEGDVTPHIRAWATGAIRRARTGR